VGEEAHNNGIQLQAADDKNIFRKCKSINQ